MKHAISRAAACLAAVLAFSGCAGDDGEGDAETATEQLSPATNICVTSDTCPYGHCSTEDGVCNAASPSCPPGSYCGTTCYGTCVATPRAPMP